VHTSGAGMSLPCHLLREIHMKHRSNLHLKEVYLLLLVFLVLWSCHIHPEPLIWLTALVAWFHGELMVRATSYQGIAFLYFCSFILSSVCLLPLIMRALYKVMGFSFSQTGCTWWKSIEFSDLVVTGCFLDLPSTGRIITDHGSVPRMNFRRNRERLKRPPSFFAGIRSMKMVKWPFGKRD